MEFFIDASRHGLMADVEMAIATGKKGGATALNSVITRHLLCTNQFDPSTTHILDFGAGSRAIQSHRLREKYPYIDAYDFPQVMANAPTLFNANAMRKPYDLVIASNVLNVQQSQLMLEATVNQLFCATRPGGTLILNIPRDPIKLHNDDRPMTYSAFKETVVDHITQRFQNAHISHVKRVCNAPTSSPIITIQKSNDDDSVVCSRWRSSR